MTVPRSLTLEFLRARSAATMAHLNGNLLDHLVATEDLLASWGATEELCRAGLGHAAYGTDGFPPHLLPWSERGALAAVVGPEVEKTIYFYASCDRSLLYPQLPGPGPVRFRDRFLDIIFEPSAGQLRDFVDLTLANEWEIATSSAPSQHFPSWIRELTDQMVGRASDGARKGVTRFLDSGPTGS